MECHEVGLCAKVFFCCIVHAIKAGEEPGNKAMFNTGYYKQLGVTLVPIVYICFEVGATPSTSFLQADKCLCMLPLHLLKLNEIVISNSKVP